MKENIIITGSSKGLGNYLSINLAENYKIIGISRKKNKKLKNTYFIDLSKERSVQLFFKRLKKKNIKIHALVLCAGDRLKRNNEYLTKRDFNLMYQNNFLSTTNLIENFVNIYKKNSQNAKIVVISSICGVQDIGAPIPFSVSKSAINFYCKMKSKVLAKKYKISLNVISPGNIIQKNNLWDKKMKHDKKKILNQIKKNVPLNRFCEPEEILKIIKLLISKKNKSISGSNFIIDGGQVK